MSAGREGFAVGWAGAGCFFELAPVFDLEGAFRDGEELAREYEALGVTGDRQVIVYCYTGLEASSVVHTLRERLGYRDVRLYDGSWSEWAMSLRHPGRAAPVRRPERWPGPRPRPTP